VGRTLLLLTDRQAGAEGLAVLGKRHQLKVPADGGPLPLQALRWPPTHPAGLDTLDLCTEDEIDLIDNPDWSVVIDKVGSYMRQPIMILEDYGHHDYKDPAVSSGSRLVERVLLPPGRARLERGAGSYSGPLDLALLRLVAPLALGDLVQPVCLPLRRAGPRPGSEPGPFTDTGVRAFIAGYGKLIPHDGTNCLTDARGRMRYHICREAGYRRPCHHSAPPGGAAWRPGGVGLDLWGPFGWCAVRRYLPQDTAVPEEDLWGFCSASCAINYTTPSTYHEQASVDVLPPGRCSR
jgi:hypothetical protein